MAHFAYVRPGDVWNANSVLLSTEMAAFDLSQFKSINGDDGGTWAPAAVITIGGQGVTITGHCTLGNLVSATVQSGGLATFNVGSTLNMSGTLNIVTGTSHVKTGSILQVDAGGTIEVSGSGGAGLIQIDSSGILLGQASSIVSLGGINTFSATSVNTFSNSSATTFGATSTLTCNNIPAFSGGFLSTGTSAFTGAVNFNGSAAVTLNSGTTLAIAGATTITGGTTYSGAGATRAFRRGIGTDANGNYDVSKDAYLVPPLSTNRIYTLTHTTGQIPVAGNRIKFTRAFSYAHQIQFQREGGTNICNFADGIDGWAEFEYFNSGLGGGLCWHCIAYGSGIGLSSYPTSAGIAD